MPRTEALRAWIDARLATVDVPPVSEWPDPTLGRPVVIGADGSDDGGHAARWAARFGGAPHFVHAMKSYGPRDAVDVEGESWAEAKHEAADDAFRSALAAYGPVPAATHVIAGAPARAIKDYATKVGAGMICVGHSAAGSIERMLLGDVTESLVHHADVSTLVARGPPGDGPVLAAVGRDDGSATAAGLAATLARALDVPLRLVHAAPEDEAPADFAGDGPDGASAHVVAWPPKDGVSDEAVAQRASLIVAGHDHSHRWLGSTVIGLIRHAPCAVMVARHRAP